MAKAVYGGLIQTILEVVGPRNQGLVGAVSLWRTRWKAMPGVLLFTGIRSWCTQMGAPTTSEGSSCYLKRTNGRGRAATTHGLRRTKTSLLGVSRQVSTREPHSADAPRMRSARRGRSLGGVWSWGLAGLDPKAVASSALRPDEAAAAAERRQRERA